jgi:hypothetical protein
MAGSGNVTADVAWAKLNTLKEGAEIASRRLWGPSFGKQPTR